MKQRMFTLFTGMALGAILFGGIPAAAAGLTAQPSWSPIYVDGQQIQITAYNILGNNYVKLRDIGKAVGFNVYYQNGVQVDSDAPYTGEAPAIPSTSASSVRISSYKGNTLPAGERSGLIVSPSGAAYTVASSNPEIVGIENVMGFWTAVAKMPGTAAITATAPDGRTGSITITVSTSLVPNSSTQMDIDLTANMEIRQEMVQLINEIRKENGVSQLSVNDALMNAAQDCSAQGFTSHNDRYECESGLAYGYPYGFGANLTVFTGAARSNIAQRAVDNWVKSSGHFQTMVAQRYDCIGVGVTVKNGQAFCYMFVGNPNGHNPYE